MKAIVVLGAAVWPDGPSPTLQRRANHAAQLWHADPSQIIVVCGGLGAHPPTEADAMASILIAAQVPEKMIKRDDTSRTTFENIQNAHKVLTPLPIGQVVIVTNGYHGPRAKMVARAFGITATVNAPDTREAHKPTHIRMILREIPAIAAYAIRILRWRWRGRDF